MIKINNSLTIKRSELQISAIRAQGAGGQNVNKVSTAIHLRFDINASSLPPSYKQKLQASKDHRLTHGSVMVIKAQNHRSQEKNLKDACDRLRHWIIEAIKVRKKRRPTKPKKSAIEKRLKHKKQRGQRKALRSRDNFD